MELIKLRRSCRNFSDAAIEDEKLNLLNDFMVGLKVCPFGSNARFKMVDAEFEGKGRVPGTYGVIKGAKHFVTGAVENNASGFVDFGYMFEQVILFATGIGMGTCWMGGTLNRSLFAEKMNVISGEILPAISPVGYPSGKGSVVDSVFRFGAKSNTRKPWSEMFFLNDFKTPLSEKTAGEYAVPLDMVRLGPSASNKQPWRIVRNDAGFHLFLERTKSYGKMVKDVDLQRLDMGIAMCHFELSARESGIGGIWDHVDVGIKHTPEATEYIASWVS
jgi:hypothetical protein